MRGMRSRASSLIENVRYDPRHSVEDVKTKLPSINNSTLFKPKKERKIVPFELVEEIQLCALRRVHPTCRIRLGNFMFSRACENFILVVIILFSVLTFVSVSMDDSSDYSEPLEIVSLILLVIFLVELLLKLYAMGWMFLKIVWNSFDIAIVILSLILCSITIAKGQQTLGFLKFSAILRLLRLTVAFRKLGDFQRIKAKMRTRESLDYSVNIASERVVEILRGVMLEPWLMCNSEMFRALSWCVDVISSNRLSETIVTVGRVDKEKEQELLDLVNQFSKSPNPSSANFPRRRSSRLSKLPILVNPETEMTLDVKQCFNTVELNDFDVFELKRLTNGNELFTLMHLLFKRKDLFGQLHINETKFKSMISRVQTGYNPVPYHNSTHAADVAQTLHYFLTTCSAGDLMLVTPLETASCYLAASVHDFEHPGLNNTYLVNTQAELALRYNDKSVLENHHISSAFSMSLNEDYDIYSDLTPADFAKMRAQMIEMVLCTDIVNHFSMVAQFKAKFANPKEIAPEEKTLCFQLLIHAADISNPSKPWDLCSAWTDMVMTEFWNQGDKERQQGLPIGYLMDRYTVNIAKSQVGFIDVIVSPTFEALRVEFPALGENCSGLQENKNKWTKRIPKYDKELAALNNPAPSPK